ncbi:hypothetical protein [Kribbella deserti]|uniref:Uncharacterized protein n=1 Tax=Kribbella deserti TaxID=1926257 RepID=A0ABV6QJZ9_9ACTN
MTGPEARAQASAVLAAIDVENGTPAERLDRIERAIRAVSTIAAQVEDEIDRLSVLRMQESLHLLAGPAAPGVDRGVLLGLAAWDGTMYLDERFVTQPIQQLYDAPGTRHDVATLRRFRFALSEMFHQESHFLAAEGTSYADSAAAFLDPVVRLLEFGVTAAWTAKHLDEYLTGLGIAQLAPGIEQVELPVGYPAYVPAVEALTAGLGELIRQPADEVLRRLNAATPAQKWEGVTWLLLGAVVPPQHRAAAAPRVRRAMHAPLAVMATLDTSDSIEAAIQNASAGAGRAAIAAGLAEVEMFRRELATGS